MLEEVNSITQPKNEEIQVEKTLCVIFCIFCGEDSVCYFLYFALPSEGRRNDVKKKSTSYCLVFCLLDNILLITFESSDSEQFCCSAILCKFLVSLISCPSRQGPLQV